MAFSTQKDFFYVPFMNETVEKGCKKACVKLKSYESTIDDRSWASDEAKQSKFLSDLVTCQYQADVGSGEGVFEDYAEDEFRGVDSQGNIIEDIDVKMDSKGPSTSKYVAKRRVDTSGTSAALSGKGKNLIPPLIHLNPGDSLLQCANIHLADYQKLLKIKTNLEKELEVSNERLKTAKEENKKIQEILKNKLDSNVSKDFYNKIQKLTSNGKLNKNEENELLKIYQKMENMCKAYEILQAENNYLKRLIEKLTERVKLENITIQPEKSSDVGYLQKELNKVRKECLMLRQIEEEYQKIKQDTGKLPSITEQDAENIKAIIKERNSLREKCKSFKALEQQVKILEKKAEQAQQEAAELSSLVSNKSQHIDKMAGEMQNMQKYYEEQNQGSCFREEVLKAQLEDLKDDLCKAKCQAQKADILAMEVSSLRNEVLKRDLALNDYDCQYKQLMDVVNELQSVKLQSLNDNETQTQKSQTDELAFYTCATLDEIMKELKRRGCLKNDDEYMEVYGLHPEPRGSNWDGYDKECCREMERLQQQVQKLEKEMQDTNNSESICEDALKRLKELETENGKLIQDNQLLSGKLLEGEEKMLNMLNKIERLDKEINRNGMEANRIGKELEGTIGLVKDISDVQLKNQQLTNAVSAINSRDDQKIIDDLKRQLDEELAKLKKCQLENAKLQEEAKVREMDLKQLKELNNKLEADRIKLETEYNKITKDKASLKEDNLNQDNKKVKGKKGNKQSDDDDAYDEDYYAYKSKENDTTGRHIVKDEKTDRIGKDIVSDDRIDQAKTFSKPQVKDEFKDFNKSSTKDKRETNDQKPLIIDPKETASKEDRKQHRDNLKSPSYQKETSQPKETDKKSLTPTSSQKAAALDDQIVTPLKSSKSKDFKHKSVSRVPIKTTDNISYNTKKMDHKQPSTNSPKAAALDNFVYQKSDIFQSNLLKGRSFEKEFRNILEDFIQECGYCFCRLFNTKSKLYAICHKLYHSGINTLSFRELAYLHKKIYAQAEQLLPGCLLDMILTDHKDQIENMLMSSMVMPRLVGGGGGGTVEENNEFDLKMSDTNLIDMEQKCCSCKSELCCNNSEEMLKEKVCKLEKDIEIAREYLENLKNIPPPTTDNGDSTDTNNSTFRASSFTMDPQKSRTAKHLKKLKARLTKPSNYN